MRLIVLFSGVGDRGTEPVIAVRNRQPPRGNGNCRTEPAAAARNREAVSGAAGYCLPSVRLYTAKCEIEY